MPESTKYHVALNVRDAIKRMSRRELKGLFLNRATMKLLTADEAKDVLLEHLALGHEVIPLDSGCEGFDYAGGGCPGHAEVRHA
jgi:hypothetical protein